MYINARAIIEQEKDGVLSIVVQVRNKPYEGGKWLELPGGRVEEYESLISALKREVCEETGLEVTIIDGIDTKLETGSTDSNVECLCPFAVYQTLRGPVDSMGVFFRCQAGGEMLPAGDETETIQWMPVLQAADLMKADPGIFNWVDRAGLQFYLKQKSLLQ